MSDFNTQPLVNAVSTAMTRFGIEPGAKIGVGVSGGPDSMVLLYILHQLGFQPVALHVNFNLRGADSLNDALFVQKWSADHDIPSFVLDKDTKAYAETLGLNTQSAAREIRYAWWEELIQHQGFSFIATAHHRDDAVETVFLNLLRGTGIKGLRGIPAKRDYFIRPMLDCSKEDIIAFASVFQIPFRTDVSNLSDSYQRNKIRHHLIPVANEIQPGLQARLSHSTHRISLEWESYHHAYEQWIDRQISRNGDGYQIQTEPGSTSFLLRWLEEKGFPWKLAYDFITAVQSASGKVLVYGAYNLSRTADGFYLEEKIADSSWTIPNEGEYQIGLYHLSVEKVSAERFETSSDPNIVFVQTDVIRWPLHVRPILPGDLFQPFGMRGQHKKLQDLMVDLKKEHHEKTHQLLLCNPEHIIWVIGIRLDERARVTEGDHFMYKIEFRRNE